MLDEKIRDVFADMVVLKDPQRSEYFSNLSMPSYMRDWLVMKFSDDDVWRIISPHNKSVRGLKWNLAYIDAYNTTLDDYMNVIIPSGDTTMVEEPKYFNWENEYFKDLVTGKRQEFKWIE